MIRRIQFLKSVQDREHQWNILYLLNKIAWMPMECALAAAISSLLWFSCQSRSPASQRVGAKCLVCALVRHVFLFAENFQVCSFNARAAGSPSNAEVPLLFQTAPEGWGISNHNINEQRVPTTSVERSPGLGGWWS